MPDHICPKCHAQNRDGARFCATCGAPLSAAAPTCLQCGATLRPGASFCQRCGTPQSSAPPSSRPPKPDNPPSPTPPAYHTPPAQPPPQPSPPPTLTPQPISPPAVRQPPHTAAQVPSTKPPYLTAIILGVFSTLLTFCLVMGIVVAPALSTDLPAIPAIDPASPNLTVRVAEDYLNEALTQTLPKGMSGKAKLDVQPDRRLVIHVTFPLLLIKLNVDVSSRIAVVDDQLQISVESIETGGREILDLIGKDSVSLGEDLSAELKARLEAELGEASRVLDITTDEQHITLTAHLALP